MRNCVIATAIPALLLATQLGTAHGQTADGARPGNDIGTRNSLPISPNASVGALRLTRLAVETVVQCQVKPTNDAALTCATAGHGRWRMPSNS